MKPGEDTMRAVVAAILMAPLGYQAAEAVVQCNFVAGAASGVTFACAADAVGQSRSDYCGPASVQSALGLRPPGCPAQRSIYNSIRAPCRSATGTRASVCNAFRAHPEGLRGAMRALSGLNSISSFRGRGREGALYEVLRGMAESSQPTAALVWEGGHWVVVKAFPTDADPLSAVNLRLNSIKVIDPYGPDKPPYTDRCDVASGRSAGGYVQDIAASTWFCEAATPDTDEHDWYWQAVPTRIAGYSTGPWADNYVAVGKRGARGKVLTPQCQLNHGTPITEEEALGFAFEASQAYLEDEDFSFLLDEPGPTEALLVNADFEGYYIVLWGEDPYAGSPGAVIVNAYTGEFQEIAAFGSPWRYLRGDEAQELASADSGLSPLGDEPQLVFQYGEESRSRYRPLWSVALTDGHEEFIRFVAQGGPVHEELTEPSKGGA
jgi:hypothetical protein